MKDYLLELFIKAQNLMRDKKGQALVEYALILVLIAVVVILMLTGLGRNVNNTFSAVNSAMAP